MLQSYYVDTHCHLDLFKDIQQTAGAENDLPIKTISVTNSPNFFEPNAKLFSGLNNIRIALGMHPELIGQFHRHTDIFENYIHDTKYIGEIGLDGSKDFKPTFDLQIQIFKKILSIIKSSDNKILTVHTRNAATKSIELLNEYLNQTNCKVILHWFTGNLNQIKQALDCGYFFSINHKMLSSIRGIELISYIPDDRLLTETDAPFTFDQIVTNRLSSLNLTVKKLAEIRNRDYDEVKHLVFNNFKNILM